MATFLNRILTEFAKNGKKLRLAGPIHNENVFFIFIKMHEQSNQIKIFLDVFRTWLLLNNNANLILILQKNKLILNSTIRFLHIQFKTKCFCVMMRKSYDKKLE